MNENELLRCDAILALRQIMAVLPSNKDWLDPNLESFARETINSIDRTAPKSTEAVKLQSIRESLNSLEHQINFTGDSQQTRDNCIRLAGKIKRQVYELERAKSTEAEEDKEISTYAEVVGADSDERTITVRIQRRPSGVKLGSTCHLKYAAIANEKGK